MWRRAGWFALLWGGGVLAVGLAAAVLRLAIPR
jgi:hypothetical protein